MDRKKITVVAAVAIILVLCLGTFSFVNLNKKELSDNINHQKSLDDDSYESDSDYGYEKSKKKKSNNDNDDLTDSSIDTKDTINALEESTSDISEKVIVTSSNTYKTTSSGNVTIENIPAHSGNPQVGNSGNGTTSSAGNNNNVGNNNGGNTGNNSGNTNNNSDSPGGSTINGNNPGGNNGNGTAPSTENNSNIGNNSGNTGDNSGNTDNSNNPGSSTGNEDNQGGNNTGNNTENNSGNTNNPNNLGGSTGNENNPGGNNNGDNTGNNSGNNDNTNNPGDSTGNENNPGGNNNGDNTGNNSGNNDNPNNPGGSTGNENNPGENNGEDGGNKDDTPELSDIDIANLVNTLKIMVEQASSRADILVAIEYRNQNKIVEETTKSGNNELISTVNDINKILNDTIPPMITGTSNGAIEKGLVLLLLTDSENDIKKITVNGSDISVEKILEFKENGTYTVVVYDDAYNKTEVTFTIQIDESELKIVNLKKSEDYLTNQDVKVTITLSKEIEAVEGWTFTDSTHTAIYKIFEENESGSVIVTDLDSQTLEIPYDIDIIDKVGPTLLNDGGKTKTYNSDGSVTMTVRFSKPVYTPRIKENGKYVSNSGWKMTGSDATTFTKTFYANKTETIYFEDAHGNIGTADIKVTGVYYSGN